MSHDSQQLDVEKTGPSGKLPAPEMDDDFDYIELGLTREEMLAHDDSDQESWMLQGYFARGRTSLLTSQRKPGKTTLLSVILARMEKGRKLARLTVSS